TLNGFIAESGTHRQVDDVSGAGRSCREPLVRSALAICGQVRYRVIDDASELNAVSRHGSNSIRPTPYPNGKMRVCRTYLERRHSYLALSRKPVRVHASEHLTSSDELAVYF